MQTIEYRSLAASEKRKWGGGPWVKEPDKKQWADPATGLPCLAVRHLELGNWCGYVGVSPDHPAYGLHYDGITIKDAKHRHARFKAMAKLVAGGASIEAATDKAFEGAESEPEIVPIGGELIRDISVHGGADLCGSVSRKRAARSRYLPCGRSWRA
ncbi:MAG: hypothetical protein KGL39_03995 [Patescibacteria group bacterium]|nr:hypothetical protein [Patescibacteria group bacterium]